MRTLIQVMLERDQKLEDYLEAKEVYGKGTPECMDAYYRWERLSDEYYKLVKEGQTMKETKAVVKARINPIVKAKALEILESLDLTTNKVIADLFEFIAETGNVPLFINVEDYAEQTKDEEDEIPQTLKVTLPASKRAFKDKNPQIEQPLLSKLAYKLESMISAEGFTFKNCISCDSDYDISLRLVTAIVDYYEKEAQILETFEEWKDTFISATCALANTFHMPETFQAKLKSWKKAF